MIDVKSNVPEIVEWLDLANLHVHSPSDAVLVCGGEQDPGAQAALSLRDAFLRVTFNPPLSKLKFRLAEETNLYSKSSAYRDWMNFESDLAQICRLVILFCESAGSIAELALFVSVDEIADRLVIVIDNINNSADSYINLGPITAFVEQYGRDRKFLLNLEDVGIKKHSEIANINLKSLRSVIENFVYQSATKHQEPRSFMPDRAGHRIKLITGLIQHYGALTIEEIDVLVWSLSLPMTETQISQYLQCAEFLEWVKTEERGQKVFWVSLESSDAIEYALKVGAPTLNKGAWKARVRQYWMDKQPDRFSAIRSNELRVVL